MSSRPATAAARAALLATTLAAALLCAGSARAQGCDTGPTVAGVDVSEWDGAVVWTAVKAAGREFAMIRASQGTTRVDARFAANWSGAQEAGLVRGAYHVLLPTEDAIAQADHFVATVGTLAIGDLPLVLDVEAIGGLSPDALGSVVTAFVDRVGVRTKRRPTIATTSAWWNGSVSGASVADVPLWILSFSPGCPALPTAWTRWTFWKTTDSGTVAGIARSAGLDVFNGTTTDLQFLTIQPPPDRVIYPPAETSSGCGHGAGSAPWGLAVLALAVLAARRPRPRAQRPT